MGKKVKVREIDHHVKVIREIGDEKINTITNGEPRMHESGGGETMRFGGSSVKISPVLENKEGGNQVPETARVAVRAASPRNSPEQSGAQLYATGRGMGNQSAGQRANYRQARQRAADTQNMMRDKGQGIPLQSKGIGQQQNVGVRNTMEQGGVVAERSYSEGAGKKRERRIGPWE